MKKYFTFRRNVCVNFVRFCFVPAVILILFAVFAAAQDRPPHTVEGRITIRQGEPAAGAVVSVEGTGKAVVSGDGGYFSITALPSQKLTFSYIGHTPQTVSVGEKTVINIALSEKPTELETVVVVGYGTQKKISLVGSVAAVSNKELLQNSLPNLAAGLGGKLPGLTAIQTNGQPGNDVVNLYIRGASTFTGNTAPLVLIDGVPRDNMSSLDPSEIESISILKDASATAVFGVRGANGVILVTTRRGAPGTMKIDASARFSMQQPLYHIDRVHSWEFARLRNEALANDGLGPEFSDSEIGLFMQGGNPFYPDRDLMDEVFKDFASQLQANVNMSGGTDRAQYFVSFGYLTQGSIYKQDQGLVRGYDGSFKYNRYNLRLNVDYKMARNLKVSLNLGADIGEANTPLGGEFIGTVFESTSRRIIDVIRKVRPVDPGPVSVAGYKDSNGNDVIPGAPVLNSSNLSSWAILNDGGYSNRTRSNLNSSLSFEWKMDFITKGLSMKGMAAFDISSESTLVGASIYPYYYTVPDRTKQVYAYEISTMAFADLVYLSRYYRSSRRVNLQYSLDYARTFGEKHELTAMILAQRDNWILGPDGLYVSSLSGDSALPYNVIGIAGRVTYNYDNRYLAEFNAGYNGSEQFAPGKRFGFFPAFSLGWVISNERFMKDKTPFTMLKVRSSYGFVGNDKQGSSRFLYMDNISVAGSGLFSSLGGGTRLDLSLIGNKDLTWETERKFNIGLDIELKYGVFAKFDYFNNYRSGILITRKSIPTIQGIPASAFPLLNEGEMKSWGYEAELGYENRFAGGLYVKVSANIGYNDNLVVYSDEQYRGDDYAYPYRFDGFRLGQIWGYKIDYSNGNGYINTEEELARYTPMYTEGTVGKPTLGDLAYIDLNGDGVIDSKDAAPIKDTTLPRITWGASASMQYRFFDLTVQFQGMSKFSGAFMPSETLGTFTGAHRQAWTKERYENGIEILYPALHISSANASNYNNDFTVEDRSFTRLKLVEAGFTLPQAWTRRVKIEAVRLSVSGQNLVTFDKLLFNHIDPEQTSYYSYPLSRVITFNVNFKF